MGFKAVERQTISASWYYLLGQYVVQMADYINDLIVHACPAGYLT